MRRFQQQAAAGAVFWRALRPTKPWIFQFVVSADHIASQPARQWLSGHEQNFSSGPEPHHHVWHFKSTHTCRDAAVYFSQIKFATKEGVREEDREGGRERGFICDVKQTMATDKHYKKYGSRLSEKHAPICAGRLWQNQNQN